jgi:hypothetical protein
LNKGLYLHSVANAAVPWSYHVSLRPQAIRGGKGEPLFTFAFKAFA